MDNLLRKLTAGTTDLVSTIAIALPTTVICEILGVSVEQTAEFKRHLDVLLDFDGNLGSALLTAADKAQDSLAQLKDLFRDLLFGATFAPENRSAYRAIPRSRQRCRLG
jgi:cytochrome P450